MSRIIRIFDTTLRDGEQSPGCSMNIEEKLMVARQLARMKVDIIEAGFPIASIGDFEAVKRIAEEIKGPVIAGLCRALDKDIDRAAEAIAPAERKRIHTFLATSDIHLQYKLKKSREEVLEQAVAAVKHARKYTDDVEFSAEDATRSDMDFLCRVVEAVINAGATTVNIPDTVGYAIPQEYGERIKGLVERVPNIDKAVISVHCHNDLGLAVSNSLAAILNGAGQVECTINGIGERAGNAAMEELVMALRTRQAFFEATTNIVTEEIMAASRLVKSVTGMTVQANKAIVGANAFAHESGIHQDGFLKEKSTYEIMTPESVGLTRSTLVLGKHSGRHAFRERLKEMGYVLGEDELNKAFERFKWLADQKKDIFDEDLEAIVAEEIFRMPETYALKSLYVSSGTGRTPEAEVVLIVEGKPATMKANGDGPVDAALRTIGEIAGTKSTMLGYEVKAITGGTDAQGEVTVKLSEDGRVVMGQGSDPDIIIASAKAYINALNKLAFLKDKGGKAAEPMCE
ncbi:MAG: 2-isopropylmalate synthase [Nitrospirae bacterium]|nr:2-isopropylmalate synthase [Nitrospirota bacterium]